jgi:hypothetical protein
MRSSPFPASCWSTGSTKSRIVGWALWAPDGLPELWLAGRRSYAHCPTSYGFIVSTESSLGRNSLAEFPVKKVTGPVNSPQKARFLWIGFQFAPKLPHVYVNRSGVGQCAVSPDGP